MFLSLRSRDEESPGSDQTCLVIIVVIADMLKVCLAFLSTIVTPYRIFKLFSPGILVRLVFNRLKLCAIVARHANILDFGMRLFVRDLSFSRSKRLLDRRLVFERKLITERNLVLGRDLISERKYCAGSCLFPLFLNLKVSPMFVD